MAYHRALFSNMGNNTSTSRDQNDINEEQTQILTSNVEFKKLNENAMLPEYQTEGSAGVDINKDLLKMILKLLLIQEKVN